MWTSIVTLALELTMVLMLILALPQAFRRSFGRLLVRAFTRDQGVYLRKKVRR